MKTTEVRALVRQDAVSLSLPNATETALELRPGMSYDEWAEVGRALGRIDRAVAWWCGDWLRYGEDHHGDRYAQMLDILEATQGAMTDEERGRARHRLWKQVMVSKAFPPPRRRAALTWTHHEEVCGLRLPDGTPDAATQDRLLSLAERHGLSSLALRKLVKDVRAMADEHEAGGKQSDPEQYLPIELPVTVEALYSVVEEYLPADQVAVLIESLGHLAETEEGAKT